MRKAQGIITVFLVTVLTWIVAGGLLVAKETKIKLVVKETSLGKPHAGMVAETMTVSPDCRHVAYIAKNRNRSCVVLDGTAGKEYDEIGAVLPPPPSRAGEEAPFAPPVIFSPDGKHLAYVARQGNKSFLVLDGAEGRQYDGVRGVLGHLFLGGSHCGPLNLAPVFSFDGKRTAYIAKRGKRYFVVVGEVEGKEYEEIGAATPPVQPKRE